MAPKWMFSAKIARIRGIWVLIALTNVVHQGMVIVVVTQGAGFLQISVGFVQGEDKMS